MDKILFLAHRIPYPPIKGDKIRSFNILRHLSASRRVYLGCFIDDESDWKHIPAVRKLCQDVCVRRLRPLSARMRSVPALLNGEPLTLSFYRDRGLSEWVEATIREEAIDTVFVFSSTMAQYVPKTIGRSLNKIIDFVDVDSDKWRQYSETVSGVMRWVYRRESRVLAEYERQTARSSGMSIFVSRQEADLFLAGAPDLEDKVIDINNGVDLVYFDRGQELPEVYNDHELPVVFTGALDYWANVDAVRWFAETIFPTVGEAVPEAVFYIVGARPVDTVRSLGERNRIKVIPDVDDIRPYLKGAKVAVAPLRIARGIQNKVLEALAMGVPTISTTAAVEGLEDYVSSGQVVSDSEIGLARGVISALENQPKAGRGQAGRHYVERYYRWDMQLEKLDKLLQSPGFC